MDDVLEMLGYDEETIRIGEEFARIYVWYWTVFGLGEALNALLDVTDHEVFSTIMTVLFEVTNTLGILAIALLTDPTLNKVAWIYYTSSSIWLFCLIAAIAYTGWFRIYYAGFFSSVAILNQANVHRLLGVAIPLCTGELLAYSEWEILTVFASWLGPTEVTAWGILGSLWDMLEMVVEAVADASEVRVAYLLGRGKPLKAEISAYKSIFLGTLVSFIGTAVIFIMGENLPTWLTKDEDIQDILAQLIPIFGAGNIALSAGTLAWTLVGAQGRYRLATAVGVAGSWLIVTPLSAASSIALGWDLRGQTGAVVIGYLVSGSVNLYLLFSSDWERQSAKVIELNQVDGTLEESSSDSDEESSSSDSVEDCAVEDSVHGSTSQASKESMPERHDGSPDRERTKHDDIRKHRASNKIIQERRDASPDEECTTQDDIRKHRK
uniref:Protein DETOXIFICATION n=1 Tax=Amphora coffeiformis TaxID=265554 RepID=A0A7S3LEK9_9STRA|mmetsp:Transcript_2740/g.5711  ORF Transcript_2740/g.5711 Transcript_2740/m.5711 type:complete len:437 (+) Transcript_2740:75-1385(+)|eukprot:scaffold17205_cov186-Amphora_coffeaeformis.AAC.4